MVLNYNYNNTNYNDLKKSIGVRSHDLGVQFTWPLPEISIPLNCSCRISIVASDVWYVAPSCWNHMSSQQRHFQISMDQWRRQSKIRSNSNSLRLHYHLVNLVWVYFVPYTSSLKRIFRAKLGFSSKCSKAQTTNTRRCVWSFTWVSWILYGCKPKSRRKIRQVEVCERQSSCARWGID